MEVKVGDLIKNRYVLKQIMLDYENNFSPIFFLYDKKEDKVIDFNRDEMMNILDIKEVNYGK